MNTGKIAKILAGSLAILMLGAAIWFWNPLPPNPSPDVLRQAAASYDAEIIRDNFGVPHIYGRRDADTSFGLAYAHAEDDFETIQEVVAATRGILASYRGAEAASTDYIVRFLDVWNTVDARYETDVPPEVRAIAEAYAAGINLYAAEHPDEVWEGLAPFKPQDVVAGFVFKTPFFYGLDRTLLSLFDGSHKSELALAPTDTARAWSIQPNSGAELGSNALAVSKDRSDDNITRLMINSHQPLTGPVAWYEAQMVSEEGLDITGGLFPGTPLILHGFNKHLGWANTVNKPDLADIYKLTINPQDPNQYWMDGQMHDFEVAEVPLTVRLWGPFAITVNQTLKVSKHGPVVENGGNAYAVRYAGRGEIRQLEQYYRLNKSRNFDEFMDAMAMNALPSINYVYADKDDNIAFIHNGQYPNRMPGWNWLQDMPGDRSDLIWEGYLPFETVPKLINPQSGLLYNANNSPFNATDGRDNLTPILFPVSMGLSRTETNRSMRLTELTNNSRPIGRDRLLALKFDLKYAENSEYPTLLRQVTAHDYGDEILNQARDHLANWDLSTDIPNRHTALAVLTLRHLVRNHDSNPTLDASRTSLSAAVDILTQNFGRIDPEWGEVNRLVRGDVNLPIDGGPDILRAVYSYGLPMNSVAYATHGDTWIALVEWDENGDQSADVIHQFGSATLDETSPHYADQAPLFANKEWRKALLTKQEVTANATRRYRPGK